MEFSDIDVVQQIDRMREDTKNTWSGIYPFIYFR